MNHNNNMHESSCRKMLRSSASKDRIISRFPQAYNENFSPNEQTDFNVRVKEACISNRVIATGLKISKAIFVGDVSVGKTCLVKRFCHDVFDRDYKATIGVDFEVERFDILQVPFNLQIWDTAGQERFKCIAASYYRGAHIVVIVFDVTDMHSLHNTKKWLAEALKENQSTPHVFLVGTKTDICSDAAYRTVEQRAAIIAKEMNAEYWSVSSKTDENVQSLFFRIAALTFEASVLREIDGYSQSHQIGNNLIRVHKDQKDIYDKKLKAGKCKICG